MGLLIHGAGQPDYILAQQVNQGVQPNIKKPLTFLENVYWID